MSAEQQFTLGVHIKLDDHYWLPVRFVKSSTLHEEPVSGTVFIEEEEYVELRNKKGEVRFAMLSSVRNPGKRDPGPCRGVKPYFWKEGTMEEQNAEGI